MSKTTGNVVNPLDLVADVGVDGFRYYVLAETPYGNDGDFTYEGLIGRYNSDLANNLGNLLARVATVVGKKCDGIGPAPTADSPLADAAAAGVRGDGRRHGRRSRPSRALDATWSLIRATNSHLEANEPWKAEPGPAVDAVMGDALEALRIVAVLASPGHPGHVPDRVGAARSRRPRRRPATAGRCRVGRLSRRARRHQGRVAVPAQGDLRPRTLDDYTDSHCHLYDTRGVAVDDVIAAARAAGVTTMVNVGCDAATTEQAIAVAASHADIFATVGLHPHEAKHGVDTIVPYLADPNIVAIGECGLDYFYDHSPRDAQRDAFAAQIATRPRASLPLVIHTRDAWADTFDILDAEGTPERTIFHCFTGGPDEARQCLERGRIPLVQRHRHVQDGDRLARGGAPRARSIGCSPRPTARTSHRCRTAVAPNQPAFVTHVVPGSPSFGVPSSTRFALLRWQRMPCVPGHSSVAFRPSPGRETPQ